MNALFEVSPSCWTIVWKSLLLAWLYLRRRRCRQYVPANVGELVTGYTTLHSRRQFSRTSTCDLRLQNFRTYIHIKLTPIRLIRISALLVTRRSTEEENSSNPAHLQRLLQKPQDPSSHSSDVLCQPVSLPKFPINEALLFDLSEILQISGFDRMSLLIVYKKIAPVLD